MMLGLVLILMLAAFLVGFRFGIWMTDQMQ